MNTRRLLVLGALFFAGCTSGGGAPSAGGDSRVTSHRGRPLPEVTQGTQWLNAQPTTLAALRGPEGIA